MSRKIVFGDIHGCYDEFEALLTQIGVNDEDEIISLGDIVDRGPKSLELYHFFRDRKNAKLIIGNHERKHLKGVLSYAQKIVKIQFKEEYNDFLKWIALQDYFYETEEAIVVHAFFEHDKKLKEQREDVLSGSTSGTRYLEQIHEEGKYWSDYYKGEKAIIYGHHVVGESPKILNNTFGIDTGACHGGRLTAIELPGFIVHQIEVKKDYWKDEMKKWQLPVLETMEWGKMSFEKIDKQIKKLRYIKDVSVQEYLDAKELWVTECKNKVKDLLPKIERKRDEILESCGKQKYNITASQYPYKVFLFKSRANNLKVSDIAANLDTPEKVIRLDRLLNETLC